MIRKDFITIIPENKIEDIDYVEKKIIENREYSVKNREEILKYSTNFDWVKVIMKHYIPSVESIIKKAYS